MFSFKVQNRFWPGLSPGPRWGSVVWRSLRRFPRCPNRQERGTLSITLPFDAFGVWRRGPVKASSPGHKGR